jgi:SAM-dependent methyltransferase
MSDDADRIIGLYDRHCQAWDRDRARYLFERNWLDRFRAFLPVGGSVLDIGCGMGEPIARFLIEAGHDVTGTDSAPSMLALARARFPDRDWIEADMRTLTLGRRFDGVLAWDSFFHLRADDQRRMFPIFRTHAAPGAPLLFTSGPEHGEAFGTFEGEVLYHASLAPEEYRALLAENGFAVVRTIANDPDCTGHTVWLARMTNTGRRNH